jgi:integrase
VAAATVNRELAALRRAFRLGVKHKRISRVPDIEMLEEAPPRERLLEPNQFEALLPHLPPYLQDFARFAYRVGWRKGALRSLRWADVDRETRRVYLRRSAPGTRSRTSSS